MKRLPTIPGRFPRFGASRAAALAGVAGLLLGTASAHGAGARSAGSAASARLVVAVAHDPVTAADTQYIDAPPAGPSVGDVRTYYLPLTRPGHRTRIGYLTGTLTTTATGKPTAGKELRAANLVFVVGRARDQLVVGGISAYSQSAPTIAQRSVAIRPVIGGSGKYATARGWCVSTHLANGTWTHVFHVTLDRA